MAPEFEEKEYEQPLNRELLGTSPNLWSPGQVFEEHFGIDAALRALDPHVWSILGYPGPLPGVILGHFRWEWIWRKIGHQRRLPGFRVNLLVQTKRSDVLRRRRGPLKGAGLSLPFWRFDLTDHQQRALELVEGRLGNQAVVTYAAPVFHELGTLYKLIENGDLISHSTFIRPSALKGHGRWAFDQPGTVGIACSDPEPIEEQGLQGRIETALAEAAEGDDGPDDDEAAATQLRRIAEGLLSVEGLDGISGERHRIALRFLETRGELFQDTPGPVYDFVTVRTILAMLGLSWLVVA